MSTPSNTVLQVFRVIGENRVPYIIELDQTMTVVADRPAVIQTRLSPQEIALEDAKTLEWLKPGALELAEKKRGAMERAERLIAEGQVVSSTAPEILGNHPELAPGVVSEKRLPNGGKSIVYKPSKQDIMVGEWVTSLITENPIPGTDELRAEYMQAEQALRDKHAAAGTTCKSCDIGALIRKYRSKLEKLGYLQQ